MPRKLRIGVVGASPARGWFTSAHLPALRALSDCIEIAAVCTSRAETAEAARTLTGARRAFTDYAELARCDEVDLVVVTVKTPLHEAVVGAALDAGKDVFCEWPLGRTIPEAERLAAKARTAGVRTLIGLQGRAGAMINTVRDLVRSGYVGRVLSVSVVASGFGWGAAIDADQTYLFDEASGAAMLNITGGHLLDALCYSCGEFREIGARLAAQRQRTAVLEQTDIDRIRAFKAILAPEDAGNSASAAPDMVRAERWFTPSAPDQLALHGVLETGAIACVHMRGGQHRGTNLLWEITGDEGELQISGGAGVAQIDPLTVKGGRGATPILDPVAPMLGYRDSMPHEPAGPGANLWRLYRAYLGDDTPPGVELADFDAALDRQRMIEIIKTSARVGRSLPWASAASAAPARDSA